MSPTGSKNAPEAKAREKIDNLLTEAGWLVQDREDMNLTAGDGVAVREFKLEKGHGFVDYLLFVDGNALGVVEAKPAGYSFTSVEFQAKKYVEGLPASLTAPQKPLPFAYISTGEETVFINALDPQPRSRRSSFHRPGTAQWLTADTLDGWLKQSVASTAANNTNPPHCGLTASHATGRSAHVAEQGAGHRESGEESVRRRPRALVQMATGTGKTLLAVTEIYRLIKFGGARRVLFLVDRANLGEQAEKEFQGFRTPDDNRKFNELYNVQRLTSNTVGSSSKVVISTIQRLYSILKGEPA
jgi:type I restriction enzyme R subunit